jgi:hypothetical protein
MAQFQVDTEKRLGSEFWSNVYQVWATDLANAQVLGGLIVAAERTFHSAQVTFTRYRTSSVAQGDGIYSITAVGQVGLRNPNDTLLPLFNTLRFDFTAATGRPSRKYYRGVLYEGDIAGDAVNTAGFVAGSNEIADLFQTDPMTVGIIDPQQETLTALVIWPFVQMRQLRRSRRRRTNSGGIFQ